MLMDSDLQFLTNVDSLLQCLPGEFYSTPGFQSPLNGGMWVLTPSECTLRDMLSIVKEGRYSNCLHWGYLGLQEMHVGADGPQGFLYYYFFVRMWPISIYVYSQRSRHRDSDRVTDSSDLISLRALTFWRFSFCS